MASRAISLPLLVLVLFTGAALGEPTASQKKALDDSVIPAFQSGNVATLAQAVNRLTAKLTAEQLSEIDAHLQERRLPSLGAMLLRTRILAMSRGRDFLKPKPQSKEVVLILPELRKEAEKVINDVSELPVISNSYPVPKTIAGYESLFQKLQAAQTRVGSASDIVSQAAAMVRSARLRRSNLSNEQREALQANYDQLSERLVKLHKQTKEREVLLRLRRLSHAIDFLRQSVDVKQRLIAAHGLDYDGTMLTRLFESRAQAKPMPEAYLSNELNDPELPKRVAEQFEEGKRLAGDLIGKARLLYTGMYWWLRGRYGRGSHFFGLVKPPEALQSQAARHLLYMPNEYPKDDQSKDYEYPDRRHYYTWVWEERTVQYRSSGFALNRPKAGPGRPLTRKPIARVASTTRRAPLTPLRRGDNRIGRGFSGTRVGPVAAMQVANRHYGPIDRPYSWTVADVYRKYGFEPPPKRQYEYKPRQKTRPSQPSISYVARFVPNQDPNLIYRVVGYVEYVNALQCLDGLAKYCSEAELKAIDELIQERKEFVIEINLSRNTDHQPNVLDEAPSPGDDYRRHGLPWVIGLARAEVGAMLVGFGGQDNAFLQLAMPYDLKSYKNLVRDGTRVHYWSLQKDAGLQMALRGEANPNRTLAYFRRLLVASGFIKGTAAMGQNDLTPEQKAELLKWNAELDKALAILSKRIRSYRAAKIRIND